MNKLIPVLVIVLVLAGAYMYRGNIKSMLMGSKPSPAPTENTVQQQPSAATAPVTEEAQPSGAVMAPQTKEITVSGTEFAFAPNAISVHKGDTVKVTFKNAGTFPHNFTISDLGVKGKTIQPGSSDTVIFTADKTGSFQYICSVGAHADKGMVGTLTVK